MYHGRVKALAEAHAKRVSSSKLKSGHYGEIENQQSGDLLEKLSRSPRGQVVKGGKQFAFTAPPWWETAPAGRVWVRQAREVPVAISKAMMPGAQEPGHGSLKQERCSTPVKAVMERHGYTCSRPRTHGVIRRRRECARCSVRRVRQRAGQELRRAVRSLSARDGSCRAWPAISSGVRSLASASSSRAPRCRMREAVALGRTLRTPAH